jgi:hypothetical protein
LPTVPSPNLSVGANDVILPITTVDLANDKLSFHGTTNEIEVASLSKGVYLMVVYSGNRKGIKKVIIN